MISFSMGLVLGNVIPGESCFHLMIKKTLFEQVVLIFLFSGGLLLTYRRVNLFNYCPFNDLKIITLSLLVLQMTDEFFLVICSFLFFSEIRLRAIVCRCMLIFPTHSMASYFGTLIAIVLKISDLVHYRLLVTVFLITPYVTSYKFLVNSHQFAMCLQRYKPIYKPNGPYQMAIKDVIVYLLQFLTLTLLVWFGKLYLPRKSCQHLFFLAVLHSNLFITKLYQLVLCSILCLLAGVITEHCFFSLLFEFFLGLGYSALFAQISKTVGRKDIFTGDLLNLFYCSACFVIFF